MGSWTGTVPTFAAGGKNRGPDMQTISDILTAATAAWSTWTPTLTNLTLGSGTVVANYRRLGQTLDYFFKFTYGAGSAVATNPRFTLPFTPHSKYAAYTDEMGSGILQDTGTAQRPGKPVLFSGSTMEIVGLSTTSVITAVTATFPHTWAATDTISMAGTIELA